MSILKLYGFCVSWLPDWAQLVVLGFLALLFVILLVKIVGFVLDAIPFL